MVVQNFLKNNNFEVLTDEGFKDFEGLLINKTSEYLKINLKDNTHIKCTLDHKIYYEKNKSKEAKNFIVGEEVLTLEGIQTIFSIENIKDEIEVFDLLEVKDTHSFYANNIKVSNCIVADEFAFVKNAEEFFSSTWPTISSSQKQKTKFFIISTPDGYNLFHQLYVNAQKGVNSFKPYTVDWNRIPGRDEKWKREQIATMGEDKYYREFECSFQSSSNGLIKATKIEELINSSINPLEKDEGNFLKIYEKPIKDNKYLITVDSAKGVGMKGDFLTFSVFNITSIPYKQVAVYKNNDISRMVFPAIIEKVGYEYNEADVFIENNDNWSGEIGSILHYDLEYPNLIYTQVTNALNRISYGYDRNSQIGLRMTQAVKKIGCSNLKTLIEHDKLVLYDYDTISEISTFVRNKDSYAAQENKHDDLVMNLVLFAWLTTQDYFKDIEQNVADDIRNIYESNIDQGLKAIGFLITGREDHDNSWYDEEEERDLREGWRRVGETLDDDQLSLLGFYR